MIVCGAGLSLYVRKALPSCAAKQIEVESRMAGPGTPISPEFASVSPFWMLAA